MKVEYGVSVRIIAANLELFLASGRRPAVRGFAQRGHEGAGCRNVSRSAKAAAGQEGSVQTISREPGARSSGRGSDGQRGFIIEL